MTGRERWNAILQRQPVDRLPWSPLVDDNTLKLVPPELRGNDGLDYYKFLDSDVLLLNGWNTPYTFRSPELCWGADVEVLHERNGDESVRTWHGAHGTLTAKFRRGHPVRYPVQTIEDVRVYRAMWEAAHFRPHDDTPTLEAIDELLGEQGVVTRFWGPSTIPRLLEEDMGVEGFYYLMADYLDEMDALIRTIHEVEREAFHLLAQGPWSSVTLVENTSTFYISPAIYDKYNMPHQREFVEIVQAAGKVALLHMCGHVHGLLPLIRETGCDGIHFLTPPPTGDTPWEVALDVLGNDLIILGALDPTIFVSGPLEEIGPALDRLITPRLRESPFVLGTCADGISVPHERFLAVRDWIERS